MAKRIWELDAFRGICILGMVAVHLVYDLGDLLAFSRSPVFLAVKQWGGTAFLLLSGICITLGKRSVRRGLIVFACGMLCTAVTVSLVLLGLADKSLIIWFGVLHCLGICMLLWPVFRKCPVWLLVTAGTLLAAAGILLEQFVQVEHPWLTPLGITQRGFATSDFFPLLPNLGFFLLGAAAGRILYREKKTLFPAADTAGFPIRFLCACGRHSLMIYLLHQPVLFAVLSAFL